MLSLRSVAVVGWPMMHFNLYAGKGNDYDPTPVFPGHFGMELIYGAPLVRVQLE